MNYNEAPLLAEITGLPTGKATFIVKTNVKELKVHSVKSCKKENGVEQTNQSPKGCDPGDTKQQIKSS